MATEVIKKTEQIFIQDFLSLAQITRQGDINYYTRHYSSGDEQKSIKSWEDITKLKVKIN